MLKRISLYTLATVGVIAIVIMIKNTFTITGQTMFGSARVAGPTSFMFQNAAKLPNNLNLKQSSLLSVANQNNEDRMIIRNASLSLEVKNVGEAINAISDMTVRSGGYVVSSTFNDSGNISLQESAAITIRIPANGLTGVLNQLKKYAIKVITEEVTGQDITDQFIDLKSKEKNLESALDQLNIIMKGAKKTTDVLKIFAEQTKLQQELDVLKGRIKYYEKAVAYSRISIQLFQDKALVNQIIKEKNQWRLTKVIKNAYDALLMGLKVSINKVVYFVISILPLLLFWGIIFYFFYFIGRKIYLHLYSK